MPSRTSLPPRRWDATGEILERRGGFPSHRDDHFAARSSRVLLMVDPPRCIVGVARGQAID